MRTIRTSVFETNSSSVHTLCVPKTMPTIHPNEVYVEGGHFGWEIRDYYSIEDKLNYIYEAIVAKYYSYSNNDEEIALIKIKELCEHIVELFKRYDVEITFEELVKDEYGYHTPVDGYIDHSEDLEEFFNDIILDDESLLKFVFGGFIHTSNDNLYEYEDKFSSQNYENEYLLYRKGN